MSTTNFDSVTAPTLIGNLTGNVTGNVTGSVTGDTSGDVTAASLTLDGTAIAATGAEINAACDNSAGNAEGLRRLMVAVARYDFAVDGGAIGAIGSGVTIPDNAIVCGGFVDVDETCVTAGADAGTMAIHVQGAGDIVAAIAVSEGTNPWDAGLHAIIPKANTPETTGIKLTAAREITFTIAGQAFTAGKFTVFLYYLQGS